MAKKTEITEVQERYIERARAADEQLEAASSSLEELTGDHAAAKESMAESIETMREAHREKGTDPSTLAGLIDDFCRREEAFNTVDRAKRSRQDNVKKLHARVLDLLRASRSEQPELFDAGNGVLIADLIGDETACRPLIAEDIRNVDDYVEKRGSNVDRLVAEGVVTREFIDRVERAVYRFLDNRDLANTWPGEAPQGEQLTLDTGSEENDETPADKLKQLAESSYSVKWERQNFLALITCHEKEPSEIYSTVVEIVAGLNESSRQRVCEYFRMIAERAEAIVEQGGES